MTVIVWLAGAGCGAGVWLFASGMRRVAPTPQRSLPWFVFGRAPVDRVDGRRVGLALVSGMVCLVLVRWPVAVAAAAAGGWLAPSLGGGAARRHAEARTEAIAQWCEMLRDAAGTARGIEGILVATAASAPEAIRPEVARMARRLEDEPLAAALDGLATGLAHPIGDLVVTSLRVAATAGSRSIAGVLGNLADAAHHEASMRRRLDVARSRPRATLRLVVLIVGAFVAGLVVFANDYMAPYGSPVGQIVLALIGGYWALGLWWMSKLGHVPEVERITAPSPGLKALP